jgi:hypothetical protein
MASTFEHQVRVRIRCATGVRYPLLLLLAEPRMAAVGRELLARGLPHRQEARLSLPLTNSGRRPPLFSGEYSL